MSTSRRSFLKRGGLVVVSAAVAGSLPRGDDVGSLRLTEATAVPQFQLIRPEDQLKLDVFYPVSGFKRVLEDGGSFLEALGSQVIELVMAPQHVLEWDVNQPSRPSRPIHTPPTRLRFHVPSGTLIPLSTAGMLAALSNMALQTHSIAGQVAEIAAPTGQASLVPAAELLRDEAAYLLDARLRGAAVMGEPVTTALDAAIARQLADAAIETDPMPPYEVSTNLAVSSRLVLSPPGGATRFAHASLPVYHGKPWAEVWYTRLAVRTSDGGRVEIPVHGRAIFWLTVTTSPEMLDSNLSGLLAETAKKIVSQNYAFIDSDPDASAIRMTGLQLSPRMGANGRFNGKWSQYSGATVKSHTHTVSHGRDVFHRTVVTGRLFPLGHPAVQTETVERQFDSSGVNGLPAVLRKQTMVSVKKQHMKYNSHTWPFTDVEILVDTTPAGIPQSVYSTADYLKVDGVPYQYKCRGKDHAGRPVEFTMPLVFVPDTFNAAYFSNLVTNYQANTSLSKVHLGRVNMAASAPGSAPGAAEVIGDAWLTASASASSMVPKVTQYFGRLPALGHLSNQALGTFIYYAPAYHDYAFDTTNNPGQAVLSLSTALKVNVTDSKAAGGLFNDMELGISGTSRKVGPVSGNLAEVASGWFKPKEYLGDTILDSLKLFGLFDLRTLIPQSLPLAEGPAIKAADVDGLRSQSFAWTVPLFPQPGPTELALTGAKLSKPEGKNPYLTIESVVEIGEDGQPRQRTTCRITDVQVSLGIGEVELIRIPMHTIEFVSVGTQKPDVNVVLGEIEFFGVLAFVNRLAQLIGGNGFGGNRSLPAGSGARAGDVAPNGPEIDVTTSGVRASYSLAIPSVAVGMFSLENIHFGASLDLPFSGKPRFGFNFATLDNPFRLSVSALTGGGFLGLGLSIDKGLEKLEGSLEFGAQIRIDLKVIKGKVSAMGGVYFKIEDGNTTLTGYLTIHGEVSVLSIITLGVLATLSLTYYNGKVQGEAELAFYVSTFFFSKTVKRNFSRTFAGSNGDPTFAELMAPHGMNPRPWDSYCRAFA